MAVDFFAAVDPEEGPRSPAIHPGDDVWMVLRKQLGYPDPFDGTGDRTVKLDWKPKSVKASAKRELRSLQTLTIGLANTRGAGRRHTPGEKLANRVETLKRDLPKVVLIADWAISHEGASLYVTKR